MHTSTRRIAISVMTGLACLLIGFLEISSSESARPDGWAIVVLGLAIAVAGTVVATKSPPTLEPIPGETVVFEGHPSMKPAFALIVIGVALFFVRVCLVAISSGIWVEIEYAPLAAGVVLCTWGIWRYWMTHCTTYCATDRRVARMYRLFWGDTNELPKGSINSINFRFGFMQRITNRGTLRFSTGGGRDGQVVDFKDIDDPSEVHRNVSAIIQSNLAGPGI